MFSGKDKKLHVNNNAAVTVREMEFSIRIKDKNSSFTEMLGILKWPGIILPVPVTLPGILFRLILKEQFHFAIIHAFIFWITGKEKDRSELVSKY